MGWSEIDASHLDIKVETTIVISGKCPECGKEFREILDDCYTCICGYFSLREPRCDVTGWIDSHNIPTEEWVRRRREKEKELALSSE